MKSIRSYAEKVLKEEQSIEGYECFYLVLNEHVRLLASCVKEVLNVGYSKEYLETLFTPLTAELLFYLGYSDLPSVNAIFYDMGEVYDCLVPDQARTKGAWRRGVKWGSGSVDLIVFSRVNVYEKIIYNLFGIRFLEIEYDEEKEVLECDCRIDLREQLVKTINEQISLFPTNVVEYIPYTLFEGLMNKDDVDYPSAKIIWLDMIYNENYLFYLAHLKSQGGFVIGQPHGGGSSQMEVPFANDIAEMMLADEYIEPLWEVGGEVLPSIRASRNLFLNAKCYLRSLFKKKNNRILVIVGFLYDGDEPNFNSCFVKDGMGLVRDITKGKIRNLVEYFNSDFDFKIHPKQEDGALELENFLMGLYPNCNVITGGAVRDVAYSYEAVVCLDYYSTVLLELSSSNVKQFVYIGPESNVNKKYWRFLMDTCITIKRSDRNEGCYIEVDNKEYRRAYGASFFYPFYIASMLKKKLGIDNKGSFLNCVGRS